MLLIFSSGLDIYKHSLIFEDAKQPFLKDFVLLQLKDMINSSIFTSRKGIMAEDLKKANQAGIGLL